MTTTSVLRGEDVRRAGVRARAGRLRRPAAGLAAQLLNAGTNVATAYVASLLLAPATFGEFVLAFAVVTLVLATARGLIGSSVLAHLPTVGAGERPALVRSACGFVLVVGLGGTTILLVASVWAPALLWFAPWVAVAAVQDLGRYVFLAEGRTTATLALDVTWAVVQVLVVVAGAVAGGGITFGLLATGWGVGALAGLVAFVVIAPAWARPAAPAPWVRGTRDVAGWFTVTAVVGQAEIYVALLLLGALLGPAATGGFRAVQLLVLQPPLVLLGAILGLTTPAFARIGRDGAPAALRATWWRAAAVVTPVAVVVLLVALLAAPIMGLLFPQYTSAAGLALPVAVQSATTAFSLPSLALLAGTRRAATSVGLQGLRVVLVLAAAVVGVAVAGAPGAAWAMAGAAVIALGPVTLAARRHLRGEAGLPWVFRARVLTRRFLFRALRAVPGVVVDAVHARWIRPDGTTRRRWRFPATVLFYRALHHDAITVPGGHGARLAVVGSRMERQLWWFGAAAYEHDGAACWRRLCAGATDVLEVGANIGWYTVAGAAGAPRYTAVEANPDAAAVVRRNLALNGLDHVEVTAAAVVGAGGPEHVALAFPDQEAHSTAPTGAHLTDGVEAVVGGAHQAAGHVITVPTTPAGPLFAGRDLVKLDIEGSEAQVLEAALPQLRASRPIVLLEVLAGSPRLLALLEGLVAEGWVARDPSSPGRATVLTTEVDRDVLLVPEERCHDL